MANVPTGITNLPSGPGNFGIGGQYAPNMKIPPGGYGALIAALDAGVAQKSARPSGTTQPASAGQFSVTAPLLQTLGAGSPLNPTVLDLMNLGTGAFASPFAGSGLLGYPGASLGAPGANMPMAPPVPGSGGKSIAG